MVTNYDLRGNTLLVSDIKTGVNTPRDAGTSIMSTAGAQDITGVKNFSEGVRTAQAVTNVHDTAPTLAELTTAFGAPATKGRGWTGTVDDADGNTNFYIVCASDASYFYLKMTKAA